jgi:hypothetical protein
MAGFRKTAITILLLALVLVSFASAANSKNVAKHSYKHISFDGDIIEAIKSLFGIDIAPDYIEVTINDQIVAQIPEDSKYANMTIHESCLGNFQYGTRDWYNCEAAYP